MSPSINNPAAERSGYVVFPEKLHSGAHTLIPPQSGGVCTPSAQINSPSSTGIGCPYDAALYTKTLQARLTGKHSPSSLPLMRWKSRLVHRNKPELFHSFAMDNGSEFMDFDGLEKSVLSDKKRVTLYYAHPYSAFERGTNENANGMIRRHFPKGTDFAAVSDTRVSFVQKWLNNYPRKIHGGKSAASFYLSPLLRAA